MKGYFMPENDKTNQTNTDISLPKEEWEKKLLENEKTAFTEFPLPQDPNEKKPADKHAVHGIWAALLLAVFAVSAASFAEVNAARKLTNHNNVNAVIYNVGAKGACTFKRRVNFCGANVCVKTERMTNAEKGFFGAKMTGESVPLRAADRAEKHAVACLAAFNSFFLLRLLHIHRQGRV